jgi:hypothetical protein
MSYTVESDLSNLKVEIKLSIKIILSNVFINFL